METSSSDATNLDNGGASSRILQFPSLRFLQSPISSLLEYSGILRVRPDYPYSEAHPFIPESMNTSGSIQNPSNSESIDSGDGVGGSGNSNNESGNSNGNGEVSIRIIGGEDRVRAGNNGENDGNGMGLSGEGSTVGADDDVNGNVSSNTAESNNSSPYQRYDIQQVARWVEQILPFSLLLLVIFIRQHLQGFVVAIYITAILFKSNDILRKQTALKGERKISVLVGYSVVFMLNIFGIYWWNRKDELYYQLLMIPPKAIPPFWHAIFIILVNDTMVRQAAMVLKLVLLMYYKNGRGHNFRRQGQMLTLVEYTLLLYRALLPTPVWYRFFLNKEYGSLFSSLTTGLYLTFKLTSIVEKALSRKEVHYGSHATSDQVNAAGDLCAICQEKMHAPILLRCKHIFCEDCVSECSPDIVESWLCYQLPSKSLPVLFSVIWPDSPINHVLARANTSGYIGSNGRELVLCAGHWLDPLIFVHTGMDQLVFSSSCFSLQTKNYSFIVASSKPAQQKRAFSETNFGKGFQDYGSVLERVYFRGKLLPVEISFVLVFDTDKLHVTVGHEKAMTRSGGSRFTHVEIACSSFIFLSHYLCLKILVDRFCITWALESGVPRLNWIEGWPKREEGQGCQLLERELGWSKWLQAWAGVEEKAMRTDWAAGRRPNSGALAGNVARWVAGQKPNAEVPAG
ncbi:hypothetical protein BUALT_Bualt01G0058000 [Buddleja alternifolia]|uniref:RING-type domain-containing protein n=1 Tax=Buddleja alternifolia TaxID=168488 RepID=A0AAV6YAS6_9LAMI|nr:hypothetical protein BUALT_Bualt01G0058000 [Buddleja alternifolia]